MIVFGLTGGIGMGKSACGRILAERGVPIIDTDVIARELVEPGRPALVEISSCFGAEVLDSDGRLNRAALAKLIFTDSAGRAELEKILHPRIRQEWRERVGSLHDGGCRRAVVVIPLLFETGAAAELDKTICIGCSPVTQSRRLMERGWTRLEIERRIAAQWPLRQKMDRADFVIWNDGGIDVSEAQLRRIEALEMA